MHGIKLPNLKGKEIFSVYLTVKQQLKHLSKDEYFSIRELCHVAKNLTNQAIYNIRQYYFNVGKYLSYQNNYKELKNSENYKLLNSNMAQQILMEVDGSFKSFFGLLKKSDYSSKVKLPKYLPKDGYATLVIGFVRLNGNKLRIPFSNLYRKRHKNIEITIPPVLLGKNVKEIRIIPKYNARFFEIQYTYEAECVSRNLNINNALAIDLGVNNLITAVTSSGNSFIIDGRRLKSINQEYNKTNSRLQSIKDKQGLGRRVTRRQNRITNKRNNRVNDYICKAARRVINYCISNDIGVLVVGMNKDFQRESDMGKRNNQTFVNIPYGRLIDKLRYLSELNGIKMIEQEESYTSKASFWDRDYIPTYDKDNRKTYRFSGTRRHRGMYETAHGKRFNADINGALNILRKSRVVSLEGLYSRGEVDTPVRIRVA